MWGGQGQNERDLTEPNVCVPKNLAIRVARTGDSSSYASQSSPLGFSPHPPLFCYLKDGQLVRVRKICPVGNPLASSSLVCCLAIVPAATPTMK